jgi:small subunit ribosomal protein S21
VAHNQNLPVACQGSKVYIADGKFESGLRKFKKKVQDSGLLLELRDREAYEKPTTERKKKASQARKRWLRRLAEDSLPKSLY